MVAEIPWVNYVCRMETLHLLSQKDSQASKTTTEPDFLTSQKHDFLQFPWDDFSKGDSGAVRTSFWVCRHFCAPTGLRNPLSPLTSHLDSAQVSTITPIITLFYFLVLLMAASQGHVLLTSISSS